MNLNHIYIIINLTFCIIPNQNFFLTKVVFQVKKILGGKREILP